MSTTDAKKISPKYLQLIAVVVLLFAIFNLSFPYLQAELTTSMYSAELGDPSKHCLKQEASQLKYYKITRFENFRKEAIVQCIYENSDLNLLLKLNYTSGWDVVFAEKLNKQGNVYWPIYL